LRLRQQNTVLSCLEARQLPRLLENYHWMAGCDTFNRTKKQKSKTSHKITGQATASKHSENLPSTCCVFSMSYWVINLSWVWS